MRRDRMTDYRRVAAKDREREKAKEREGSKQKKNRETEEERVGKEVEENWIAEMQKFSSKLLKLLECVSVGRGSHANRCSRARAREGGRAFLFSLRAERKSGAFPRRPG